jgi:uncharacterized protein (UPF0276 family)
VSTLLEWDADIPPFPDLVAELAKAREVRAGRYPAEAPTHRAAAGSVHIQTALQVLDAQR